jgi:probable phosphoglycerate mutase
MLLFLCRHGETEWSLSGQHTGKTDIGLTARGKAQAIRLRKKLQQFEFEKIYTSPLRRAKETCEGMGAEEDPHLMEWDYGNYEGKKGSEIGEWDVFREGAPGGESPEEVKVRADAFLKKVKSLQGNVAVFSHGHFLRALTARFLETSVAFGSHLVLGVGSLSILGFEKKNPAIILWNDPNDQIAELLPQKR